MNPLALMVNAVRRLESFFPGYFTEAKHNHYRDFGFPETLTFPLLYTMYQRNGIARAVVDKTILKTWQDNPWLLEKERDGSQGKMADETPLEKDIRTRFDDLRVWQNIAEADRRSLVGEYSGLILRLADGLTFDQPVGTVRGGLMGLVEVIPAWEAQLTVNEWHDDETDTENYGKPKSFQFNEAAFGANEKRNNRQFTVHPDRVIIFSDDGTVNGTSALEACYNDLMTLEKVSGAGGEGFWKNAKSAPVLEIDKDAKVSEMAQRMGIPKEEIADKMGEQVEDWQKGFDKLLMLQGMQAKTLGITLPSPEHFFNIALQSVAASRSIPLKILVGSQSGERASTEDAAEWAKTNMSRRTNIVIPNIMAFVRRLEKFNILTQGKDWFIDWSDLTETSMSEKIDRAVKMADVNQKMKDSGEIVFTSEEIRETVEKEPLSDAEKYRDDGTVEDGTVEDATAALTTAPQKEPAQ